MVRSQADRASGNERGGGREGRGKRDRRKKSEPSFELNMGEGVVPGDGVGVRPCVEDHKAGQRCGE